jgi:hypothetical protein
VRRAFGIVFQDPSLDGEAAAAENMELHGVLYRVPRAERRARVEALLCSDTSSRTLVISVPFAPKRPRIHKWDQEFESAFLQRRVRCELGPVQASAARSLAERVVRPVVLVTDAGETILDTGDYVRTGHSHAVPTRRGRLHCRTRTSSC